MSSAGEQAAAKSAILEQGRADIQRSTALTSARSRSEKNTGSTSPDRASKKLGRGQRDSGERKAIREADDGGALAPELRDRRGGKSTIERADRVGGGDERAETIVARGRGGGIGHVFSLPSAIP